MHLLCIARVYVSLGFVSYIWCSFAGFVYKIIPLAAFEIENFICILLLLCYTALDFENAIFLHVCSCVLFW